MESISLLKSLKNIWPLLYRFLKARAQENQAAGKLAGVRKSVRLLLPLENIAAAPKKEVSKWISNIRVDRKKQIFFSKS